MKPSSEVDSSDDDNPLCDRCQSDDAEYICIDCGSVKLCDSCGDLIHSLGIYEKHQRKGLDEVNSEQDDPGEAKVLTTIENMDEPESALEESESAGIQIRNAEEYNNYLTELETAFNL